LGNKELEKSEGGGGFIDYQNAREREETPAPDLQVNLGRNYLSGRATKMFAADREANSSSVKNAWEKHANQDGGETDSRRGERGRTVIARESVC